MVARRRRPVLFAILGAVAATRHLQEEEICDSSFCSFRTISVLTPDVTLCQCINSHEGTVTIEVIRSKQVWLGIGLGDDNHPEASSPKDESPFVVGMPDDHMVRIMNFGNRGAQGMGEHNLQSNLRDVRTRQNSTHTMLKVILEPRRRILSNADNTERYQGWDRIVVASGFDNNFEMQELLLSHPLESHVLGFLEKDQGTFPLPASLSRTLQEETEEPTDEPTEEDYPNQGFWIAHAILMTLSWGLLVPLAIGSSIIRNLFADGVWLQIHRTLNSVSLFLTVLAFGLAFYAVRDAEESTSSASDEIEIILENSHRFVGVIVVLLSLVQALTGVVRPQAADEIIEVLEDPQDERNNNGADISTIGPPNGESFDNDADASIVRQTQGDPFEAENENDASTIRRTGSGESYSIGQNDTSTIRRTGSGESHNIGVDASPIRPDRGELSTIRADASTIRYHGGELSTVRGSQRVIVENRSSRRKVWELQHRLLGIGLIAGSWYNIHRGIDMYEDRYGSLLDDEGRSTTEIFWGGIIGLVVSFFVLATIARVFS